MNMHDALFGTDTHIKFDSLDKRYLEEVRESAMKYLQDVVKGNYFDKCGIYALDYDDSALNDGRCIQMTFADDSVSEHYLNNFAKDHSFDFYVYAKMKKLVIETYSDDLLQKIGSSELMICKSYAIMTACKILSSEELDDELSFEYQFDEHKNLTEVM